MPVKENAQPTTIDPKKAFIMSTPEKLTLEGPKEYEPKTITSITIKQPTNAPIANLLIKSIFIKSPTNPKPL